MDARQPRYATGLLCAILLSGSLPAATLALSAPPSAGVSTSEIGSRVPGLAGGGSVERPFVETGIPGEGGLATSGTEVANAAGDILDTSRVTIPEAKFGYLLENPRKAGVFADSMGFDKASLGSALRNQLFENFGSASSSVPMVNGEGLQIGTKFSVTSALTGPSGATWNITSAWASTGTGPSG
ncbi:MAG: hypothetical protein H0U52_05265 [Chloroflexi bacterium]|nr:hypothetical protein [Chloroflexota bacterium]